MSARVQLDLSHKSSELRLLAQSSQIPNFTVGLIHRQFAPSLPNARTRTKTTVRNTGARGNTTDTQPSTNMYTHQTNKQEGKLHAHMRAYTHTQTDTHRHTQTHTDTQTHTHTDAQTHTHKHTHTETETHRRKHTQTQTHTHRHACMHACMHTYIHTNKQAGRLPPSKIEQRSFGLLKDQQVALSCFQST